MRSFLRYFLLLIATITVLTAYLPIYFGTTYPSQAGPVFDTQIDMTHRDGIAAQRPQVILLGDSMVQENVDTPALSKALGRSVYTISYPDSGPALWYLFIKNNILASPYKPPTLIIVFHGTSLTTPSYRVDRKIKKLDSLATPNDALLIRLAFINRMNPLEKFALRYFPLYKFAPDLRDSINSFINYYSHRPFYSCGKRCIDSAFMNIFNSHTMTLPNANEQISQESILYTENSMDFSARVNESFLPEIIRLCKENEIKLVLVQAKTNSFQNGIEPVTIKKYMDTLSSYLTKNNVAYVDINADQRMNSEDFMDWFHVFPEAREIYTLILAEALKPLLETGQ